MSEKIGTGRPEQSGRTGHTVKPDDHSEPLERRNGVASRQVSGERREVICEKRDGSGGSRRVGSAGRRRELSAGQHGDVASPETENIDDEVYYDRFVAPVVDEMTSHFQGKGFMFTSLIPTSF